MIKYVIIKIFVSYVKYYLKSDNLHIPCISLGTGLLSVYRGGICGSGYNWLQVFEIVEVYL